MSKIHKNHIHINHEGPRSFEGPNDIFQPYGIARPKYNPVKGISGDNTAQTFRVRSLAEIDGLGAEDQREVTDSSFKGVTEETGLVGFGQTHVQYDRLDREDRRDPSSFAYDELGEVGPRVDPYTGAVNPYRQ